MAIFKSADTAHLILWYLGDAIRYAVSADLKMDAGNRPLSKARGSYPLIHHSLRRAFTVIFFYKILEFAGPICQANKARREECPVFLQTILIPLKKNLAIHPLLLKKLFLNKCVIFIKS